jgi:hypothetical protein
MLQQFLEILSSGSVHTQLEIARRLNISPDMVLTIARDLTARGYLEESSGDASCCSSDNACSGCPVSSGCHSSPHLWFLTEKGEKALASRKTG